MKVNSIDKAWTAAAEIFPADYARDETASNNAGYNVYRSTAEGHFYDYICELGDRLEVNFSDGRTVNIWIVEAADAPQNTVSVSVQGIAHRIIQTIRIVNILELEWDKDELKYTEIRPRTRYDYELTGAVKLLKAMNINIEFEFDARVVECVAVIINGEKFNI